MDKPAARKPKSKSKPARPAKQRVVTARQTVASTGAAASKSTGGKPRGAPKWVYAFGGGKAEGKAGMRNLLGGKGAGLAEMANLGLPVPPGFTITTDVCTRYYADGKTYPKELASQVAA